MQRSVGSRSIRQRKQPKHEVARKSKYPFPDRGYHPGPVFFDRAAAVRVAKHLIAEGLHEKIVIIKGKNAFARGSTWQLAITAPTWESVS